MATAGQSNQDFLDSFYALSHPVVDSKVKLTLQAYIYDRATDRLHHPPTVRRLSQPTDGHYPEKVADRYRHRDGLVLEHRLPQPPHETHAPHTDHTQHCEKHKAQLDGEPILNDPPKYCGCFGK
eukprot:Selendium_serpulae@DN346_c0_g1_i2.p2